MDGVRIDDLIDRQRLRRKLGFWRILTFLAAIGCVMLVTLLLLDPETFGQTSRPHVAHVKIAATITEDEDLLDRLDRIKSSQNVKGVIISVDSPGGTTAGGEAIYEAIREVADEKPTVTQVGTLAASAGYMVSVAADHIVARQSSIIGSIGVIFQYPNIEELLTNWGIDMRSVKSTPLKAEPNFYGETPVGAEQMIEAMILDSFDWFKGIVAERRGFDQATIARLADGSVFTGRQALELEMIDQLGGLDEARDWLTSQGLDEDLDLVVYEREDTRTGSLFLQSVAHAIGFNTEHGFAGRIQERVFLDGLLSIWHGGDN
ncbi:MAG: signal peptide peptidase SppA [Pseudomonadota bacterium]